MKGGEAERQKGPEESEKREAEIEKRSDSGSIWFNGLYLQIVDVLVDPIVA